MKMTLRWFGSNHDSVPLKYIRQIPGVHGVITSLMDIPVGEVWSNEAIGALKKEVTDAGLAIDGIESVNVHESIKLGDPDRDRCIENYIQTIKNLAKADIHMICYNFMPVLDWLRTDLARELDDGSNTMAYTVKTVQDTTPEELVRSVADGSGKFTLPGWEGERLAQIGNVLKAYENITQEDMFKHAKYFLEAIIPVCEEFDVKMAIHPDDPPWSIFGLPRIMTNEDNLARYLKLVDSPYNGLTLCSGSLGVGDGNDIPRMVRKFGNRIHFAHVRNLKKLPNGDFYESAHLSSEGSLDLYEIMRAYHDVGFEGVMRPDHGRMIWGEEGRAGYGLYDRALGANYLLGLWEAIGKEKARGNA